MGIERIDLQAHSSAQCCPEDVLHLIFADLSKTALYHAALVCQQWATPAQQGLLRTLWIPLWKKGTRFVALLATLQETKHLRNYVRHLTIHPGDDFSPTWSQLLDCPNLSSLALNCSFGYERELWNALHASPVVYSHLRRLVVTKPDILANSDMINPLVAYNDNLVSFAISLNPYDSYSALLPNSSIRRLTLRSTASKHDIQIINFIEAYGRNLERLDLVLLMPITPSFFASLVEALSRFASNLSSFHFEANVDCGGEDDDHCSLPLLDELLTNNPFTNLQYLFMGGSSYTSSAFVSLPSTLKMLIIERDAAGDALTEGLMPFLKSTSCSLKRLTIQPRYERASEGKKDEDEYLMLRGICQEAGVQLNVADGLPFGSTFAQLFAVEA